MARISVQNLHVDFPIYNRRARSLKRALVPQKVGGNIRGVDGNITVVRALNAINLDIADGDRVALIGRNGSGKTTLLRVLGKIYDPTRGRVDIEGEVTSMTDLFMGMDPEESGYENVRLRSIFLGFTSAQTKSIVADVEEFTELGDFLSLPIRTYSSGMLLRLGFAIATAIMPEIVIMDELINVGDAAFIDKATKRLNGMMDKARIVVIATHDPSTAVNFCNRAVLLEAGHLIAEGPPDAMWELYRQRTG